jgi:hypothetical protein
MYQFKRRQKSWSTYLKINVINILKSLCQVGFLVSLQK